MSYNRVLKEFAKIDTGLFTDVKETKKRGRPKKQPTSFIELPEFFGAFSEDLFGAGGLGTGKQIIPPRKSIPQTPPLQPPPPVNINLNQLPAEPNDDFDFTDELFEGEIEGELNITQLLDVGQSIVDEFVSSGEYNSYDLGRLIIETEDGITAFESEYEELEVLADELAGDFVDEDDKQFYNKIWSTEEKKYIYVSKNFTIFIRIVANPNMGYSSLKIKSVADLRLKKSVVCINNTDDLCFFRCIAVAIAKQNKHPNIKNIVNGRKIQTELTKEFMDSYGFTEMKGLETIKQVEKDLNCCITIIDTNNFLNVSYPNVKSEDYEPKDWNIYLLKT